MIDSFKKEILGVNSSNFNDLALKIFRFQALNCATYKSYIQNLGIDITLVNTIEKIPFLPISFFKSQTVLIDNSNIQTIFESSGTAGQNTSKHFVSDLDFYKKISLTIFEKFYGPIENYHIIAILPSYLERGNSSLVYMVKNFIEKSNSQFSAFYSLDYESIINIIEQLKAEKNNDKKILIWGVTFALVDLVEFGYDFSELASRLIIIETGGMKGRRKEMIREELYLKLKSGFSVAEIHSEYGMTELLSQAYSKNDGLFYESNSMKILLREMNDPFSILQKTDNKKTGGINVIDLANVESCSFIETQDLGQYGEFDKSFKVLGRFDNSDLRGCNLLVY
jgi:hypothetical protein